MFTFQLADQPIDQPIDQEFCIRCDKINIESRENTESKIDTNAGSKVDPTTNKKPKRRSTDYYRNNRINKFKTYRCPFENCGYETHNSKSVLTNHINAKHVSESERPYQCKEPGCCRGFSQKAHLANHMKKHHNKEISLLEGRTTDIIYTISITDKIPRTKSTVARREFYIKNPILKGSKIFNKKYNYLDDKHIKNHDLHYDVKKGFINMEKTLEKQTPQSTPPSTTRPPTTPPPTTPPPTTLPPKKLKLRTILKNSRKKCRQPTQPTQPTQPAQPVIKRGRYSY
tara:strand:+ start:704 stop:1558 length:855 start_codon:yes stop_codon:yes gene_type:complete